MSTLENLLSPLCVAIRDKVYKSKQAAFDNYIDSILTAKESYSWEQISEFINLYTDSNIAPMSYRHMLTRAKNKRNKSVQTRTASEKNPAQEQSGSTTERFFTSREETSVKHDSTASMDKFKKYL